MNLKLLMNCSMKIFLLTAIMASVFMISCKEAQKAEPIPASQFEKEVDGKSIALYTLSNKNGMTAEITNFGGRVVSLWVQDKSGDFKDVVLGLESIDQYISEGEYFGALIGRYGNRIANGKFSLTGKDYTLALNNNGNSLHGGVKGFHAVIWDATPFKTGAGDDALALHYLAKDQEEGFPGNLDVKVVYTLTADNSLKIDYEATTDDTTVLNLTHHSFFNLNGAGVGDVNNHVLMLNADYYTPTNETLIPTGEVASVKGTPMDFLQPTEIGKRVDQQFPALLMGNGYDHNFVLNQRTSKEMTLAAEIFSPLTGIKMRVETSEPAVQFYGGNFLKGDLKGKRGQSYPFRSAFCLETQHYPDSPNQPNFPSTVLVPGDRYTQTCVYLFSVN